jgi:hypothetical protein
MDFLTQNSCPYIYAGYEEQRTASTNKEKPQEMEE